jgi:hypothetical protein
LKSVRGVRVGKTISCPSCATSFTVRADSDPPVVPVGRPWAPPPGVAAGRPAGGVNGLRLSIALLGMLLYLAGGATLGFYCFTRNQSEDPSERVQGPGEPSSSTDTGEADVPAPAPPPLASTDNLTTAEQKKINDAIVKGVWFLRDTQRPNGSWDENFAVGYAALAGLTLLECGVPANDPAVQKAATFVRNESVKLGTNCDNYQRSLTILFLDRLGESKDRSLIQYLALCLIAGQHPTDGAWSYSAPALDRALVPQLLKQLGDKKKSLGDWRKTALKGGTYTVAGWDNSNTQFVILALWVAQRHQVPIAKSIALVEKHFRDTQLPNGPDPANNNLNLGGSWYYNTDGNSGVWPSMTCAGLLGLAIAHGVSQDKKQKPLDDLAVKQGLAMLAREIDRPGESRSPDYYFLWSLERVGVLYNLTKIEGKDWYAWGCKTLLPIQLGDGSWRIGRYYGETPIVNTCFVLLFLKRANLAADLTSKLQLLSEKK